MENKKELCNLFFVQQVEIVSKKEKEKKKKNTVQLQSPSKIIK
jgi:hypothetical protein